MNKELIGLSAVEAVKRLESGELSPLDLVEAAQARIEQVEPAVNALPTTCFERARRHARQLMSNKSDQARPRGWLGGVPITIKDMLDVEGVRTTHGSLLFKDYIPTASHPLVQRIEKLGGIVIAKSNVPEFAVGGSTFNEVFGRTRNPWNTSLTSGGSTGGGAVSVATGEAWLAHGSDHAGSLRRPAAYCSVVGLRPSVGRVTRGSVDNLFSPLVVEGPMARSVADLALFLDTMAGWCLQDPLTYDAPARSYADAVSAARAEAPRKIAFCPDFGGKVPMDRETREICSAAVRSFETAGCIVDEVSIDLGELTEAFLILRDQVFVVDFEHRLKNSRSALRKDIVWSTERGLQATAMSIAWADRERAAFCRKVAKVFEHYDVIVVPTAPTPAFDVNLANPETIDGKKLDHYLAGSMLAGAITITGCPAVSIPVGTDKYGRPVGMQVVAPSRRDDRALQAAAIFEQIRGWKLNVPVDPKQGTVPPLETH